MEPNNQPCVEGLEATTSRIGQVLNSKLTRPVPEDIRSCSPEQKHLLMGTAQLDLGALRLRKKILEWEKTSLKNGNLDDGAVDPPHSRANLKAAEAEEQRLIQCEETSERNYAALAANLQYTLQNVAKSRGQGQFPQVWLETRQSLESLTRNLIEAGDRKAKAISTREAAQASLGSLRDEYLQARFADIENELQDIQTMAAGTSSLIRCFDEMGLR